MLQAWRTALVCGALALVVFLSAQGGGEQATAKAPSERVSARGNAERGKKVYRKNCGICHYSTTEKQKIGPGMKDIYKRGTFAGGKKVDDANMRAWIAKGNDRMPPFKEVLTAREMADWIAYLKTL